MSNTKLPRVAMLSFWRDDANKRIEERVQHLLGKSYPNLRYVWVVGDSTDETEDYLRGIAAKDKRVTVVRFDTNIEGDDPNTRLHRLGLTANAGLEAIRKGDVHGMIHESDLISPVDIVEQFIASGKEVIAGFVWLGEIHYDVFAYRKNGVKFTNHPPYFPGLDMNGLNEVDSVGSCWLFPARVKLRCTIGGCVEMCDNLRVMGYSIWCDPRIRIEQPIDLWTSRSHASY